MCLEKYSQMFACMHFDLYLVYSESSWSRIFILSCLMSFTGLYFYVYFGIWEIILNMCLDERNVQLLQIEYKHYPLAIFPHLSFLIRVGLIN